MVALIFRRAERISPIKTLTRKFTVLPAKTLIQSHYLDLKMRQKSSMGSTNKVIKELLMPTERPLRSTLKTWKQADTRKTSRLSRNTSLIQTVLQIPLSGLIMLKVVINFIKFGDQTTSVKDNNRSKASQSLRNSQLVNHGPYIKSIVTHKNTIIITKTKKRWSKLLNFQWVVLILPIETSLKVMLIKQPMQEQSPPQLVLRPTLQEERTHSMVFSTTMTVPLSIQPLDNKSKSKVDSSEEFITIERPT